MGEIRVVARYTDGRVIKGFTQDFFPNKDRFHLILDENRRTVEALLPRLKAVFFVRDFSGDSQYQERKRYLQGENPGGVKLEVTFADGEVLVGSTPLGYDPKRQGFFVTPADPGSNNLRVFVVASAVKGVRQLFDYLLEGATPEQGTASRGITGSVAREPGLAGS